MTSHLDTEQLLEGDLRILATTPDAAAHLEICRSCAERLDLLLSAEVELRHALDCVVAETSAVRVTGHALHRAHVRAFWERATLVVLVLIFAFVVSPWGRRSQVALGRWSATPPPRVVESYALRCLAPARAAELVLSRLESDGSDARPVSDSTPVLVVSATTQEHVMVGRLLARFDQEGSVLCRY